MTSETNRREQKLTVRDLITTSIFSAIILICISLSGGPFAMFPILISYFPIGAAFLIGPAYLLLVAKVPKSGPIFTAGLIMAIFCYVTGMHIGMSIGYLAGGALVDLAARTERYRNVKINTLSCIIFCFGGTGLYLAYFINPQTWVNRMSERGTPQGYLDTMVATVNHRTLISMLAGTVLAALFSDFIDSRLLEKQFEKARATT